MDSASWKCPQCETINDGETEVCAVCGGVKSQSAEVTLPPLIKENKAYISSPSPAAVPSKSSGKAKTLSVFLFALSVLLGAFCFYQANQINQLSVNLSDAYIQIDSLESERDSLNAALKSAQEDLEPSKEDAAKWNAFVKKAQINPIGYESSDFFADRSVIIMRESSYPQKLTVTFRHYGTIHLDTDGNSVSASWSRKWDGDSTQVNITPKTTGVSYLKFTSTYDSTYSFIVVVIVI